MIQLAGPLILNLEFATIKLGRSLLDKWTRERRGVPPEIANVRVYVGVTIRRALKEVIYWRDNLVKLTPVGGNPRDDVPGSRVNERWFKFSREPLARSMYVTYVHMYTFHPRSREDPRHVISDPLRLLFVYCPADLAQR